MVFRLLRRLSDRLLQTGVDKGGQGRLHVRGKLTSTASMFKNSGSSGSTPSNVVGRWYSPFIGGLLLGRSSAACLRLPPFVAFFSEGMSSFHIWGFFNVPIRIPSAPKVPSPMVALCTIPLSDCNDSPFSCLTEVHLASSITLRNDSAWSASYAK